MGCLHGLRGTSSRSWNVRSIGPESECTGLGTGDDLMVESRSFGKLFPSRLGTTVPRHDTVPRRDTNMGT